MKIQFGLKRCAALACAIVIAGSAFAQAGQSQKLYLDLKDADIYSAVMALSRQTGLQFVIGDRDKPYQQITLSLRDADPEEAIKHICTAAGGYAVRDESGVYVIHFGERPANAAPEVKPIETVKEPLMPVKIQPRRVDGAYIIEQITGRYQHDPMEAFRDVQKVNGSGVASWRKSSIPNTQVVMPYQGGVATQTLGGIDQTGPGANMPESANNIWLPGGTANQVGGFPGGGGGGGLQGGGQGGQGGGQGGQGNGGVQLTPGEGLVPDGIEYIGYDPSDGSLVVQGTSTAISRLRQIIDLFDVAPQQVEIKVEFITTSQSLDKSFGLEWQLSRGSIFTGTRPDSFARLGDPIFVNYSTGNLVTRLRASLLSGSGKVVNAPIIRTFSNQLATVFQNASTSIFTPVISTGAGGNVVTYNITQLPISSGLSVRPRVMPDGYVTMTLAPTISEYGQIRRAPDGTEVPDTLFQGIFVSTRVKDGDTIVLGGLNRTQTSESLNRFPILGDLPIIGQFFRSSVTIRNDQELLIFVTPRIIREEEDDFGAP